MNNNVMSNEKFIGGITNEEWNIYHKVRHEFLKQDARSFLLYYLADIRRCSFLDISDEEMDSYENDYNNLAYEFENDEDCNVAYNDMWDEVIRRYFDRENRELK